MNTLVTTGNPTEGPWKWMFMRNEFFHTAHMIAGLRRNGMPKAMNAVLWITNEMDKAGYSTLIRVLGDTSTPISACILRVYNSRKKIFIELNVRGNGIIQAGTSLYDLNTALITIKQTLQENRPDENKRQ